MDTPSTPKSEADRFCDRMDAMFGMAFQGAPSFDEYQQCQTLKARARGLFEKAAACERAGTATAGLRAEADQWRAYIKAQEEKLASCAARHEKDMARAEELKLRPKIAGLLPLLDAVDLAKQAAAAPGATADTLKDGAAAIGELVRGVADSIKKEVFS